MWVEHISWEPRAVLYHNFLVSGPANIEAAIYLAKVTLSLSTAPPHLPSEWAHSPSEGCLSTDREDCLFVFLRLCAGFSRRRPKSACS